MKKEDCKVGMRVTWTSNSCRKYGKVTGLKGNGAYIDKEGAYTVFKSYINITPTDPAITENKPTTKSWSFGSLHESDIDFEEIKKDLTRQNPVAIVTISCKEKRTLYCLIVHMSIIEKDKIINPSNGRIKEITWLDKQSHISDALEAIKVLKNTPWPKESRRKAKVTVVLPSI